ncbi:hypothetical protein ACFE04_001703 [Oxalis oulophora]
MAIPFTRLTRRSTTTTLTLTIRSAFSVNRCCGGPRWASSSSKTKPEEDKSRLSTVIDAVKDRKLPPELRGQRNAVSNPHADPAEDTLYRILSKSGFAPEWVELNKEIRDKISGWRSTLKKAWEIKCSGDNAKWVQISEVLKGQLKDINDKVFRYNLIVPFGRQMSGLKWEKELSRIEE